MIVDIILIAIMAIAVFVGWKRGLVMSVFLLGATIIAIFVASVLSPVVATGLEKLGVADAMAPKFSSIVEENLMEEYNENGAVDVNSAIEKLPLPSFLTEKISSGVNDKAEESISKISADIGAKAATLACAVIAFIIIFVLVIIVMQVLKIALKIAVKLPLVKQTDKIGGILVGFLQGALVVLVLLLFVSTLSSTEFMSGIVKEIENSTITAFLYESNFIGKIFSALM